MAHPAVVTAVEARLAANWTTTPIIGLNLQGEAPADGSPFVVVDYPVADVRRISTGTRLYREEGAFRLVLNAERGAGRTTGLAQAEALAVIFRDQKFSDVESLAPSSPIIDDRNDQGNYFSLVTVCPYSYDYLA